MMAGNLKVEGESEEKFCGGAVEGIWQTAGWYQRGPAYNVCHKFLPVGSS